MLAEHFLFDLGDVQAVPRYNIPPTTEVLAVRLADGKRQLAALRWGLIPSWSKDAKIAYSTINARGDTIATKPAFRTAFKKRRCLVLADGYFEWLKQGKGNQPYLYEVDGGSPFAFAGLWEWWGGPEGENAPVECQRCRRSAQSVSASTDDRPQITSAPSTPPRCAQRLSASTDDRPEPPHVPALDLECSTPFGING